jgi:hypothetical protein
LGRKKITGFHPHGVQHGPFSPTVKFFIGGKTFYQPEKARFWGIKATTPTQSSKFSLPLILGGQPLRKKTEKWLLGLAFRSSGARR